MKIGGHDTDFVLDLGQNYQWSSLQIDQVTIENKFCPFYASQKIDFRIADFSVIINGAESAVSLVCDQFITTTNVVAWLNKQMFEKGFDIEFVAVAQDEWKYVLSFQIRKRTNAAVLAQSIKLPLRSGFWDKLGFKLSDDFKAGSTITAARVYDFGQPPVILVQVDQIAGNGQIGNQFGTAVVAVPNNSSFGSRIQFLNVQRSSTNVIYNVAQQSLRYLNVRLLTCDQTALESVRANNPGVNMNDLEVILIFSLR